MVLFSNFLQSEAPDKKAPGLRKQVEHLSVIESQPENLPLLQRARGAAQISFKRRGARSVLNGLHQSGCLKVRQPRGQAEAILINTAGGLTDGDSLDVACHWAEETAARITTQTCERVYRSRGETASINTKLDIEPGARAAWLPQETILFDGGRLERHTQVNLSGDATLLACEAVIMGRPAMGEHVSSGSLSDFWTIRRDGRLVFADRFGIHGDLAAKMDRQAVGNGARAWASILICGRDLIKDTRHVAALVSKVGATAGVSHLGDVMLVRVLAACGYELRKSVTQILEAIPGGAPLPRVWSI